MDDGGFTHTKNQSDTSDGIAGEQALSAFITMYRYYGGYRSLYDLRAEQSAELKDSIKNLRNKIKTLSENSSADEIKIVFEQYKLIPISERSYVYEYPKLSELMKFQNIANTSESLAENLGERESGNGTVTDLFGSGIITEETIFSEADSAEVRSLPEKLSTENYVKVIKLIDKLERAANKNEYTNLLEQLKNLKTELEALYDEINDINAQISDILSVDDFKRSDADLIDTLLEKVEKLSEHDKKLIIGYENLMQAKAKIATQARQPYIIAGGFTAVIVLLTIFVLRIKKRREAKKIPESDE